jgi:hypothetical protein
MRYPASEKAEIIDLVEGSHLPAKRTLDQLGIPRSTFYRWYDRYLEGGIEPLADRRSRPIAFGIASRTTFAGRSSIWRCRFLSCHLGSWPCGSLTRESSSSPRLRSIGC